MNLLEIEKEILQLEKQRVIEKEKSNKAHQDFLNKREVFFDKIRTTNDIDFMRQILTACSVVDTPSYSWQEFYCLCYNPHLTDEIIDLLLTKEARYMIVQKLLFNDNLTFLQSKKVLKSGYFRTLKEQYTQRINL